MEDTEIGMEEDGVEKSADCYWGEIMKIKMAKGQMWFPTLAQLMVSVLSLPDSNADAERVFHCPESVCRVSSEP